MKANLFVSTKLSDRAYKIQKKNQYSPLAQFLLNFKINIIVGAFWKRYNVVGFSLSKIGPHEEHRQWENEFQKIYNHKLITISI